MFEKFIRLNKKIKYNNKLILILFLLTLLIYVLDTSKTWLVFSSIVIIVVFDILNIILKKNMKNILNQYENKYNIKVNLYKNKKIKGLKTEKEFLNYLYENYDIDIEAELTSRYMELKNKVFSEEFLRKKVLMILVTFITTVTILISNNIVSFIILFLISNFILVLIYSAFLVKTKLYKQVIDQINDYVAYENISDKKYKASFFLPPKKVKKFKLFVKDPLCILMKSKDEEQFKQQVEVFYNNLKREEYM